MAAVTAAPRPVAPEIRPDDDRTYAGPVALGQIVRGLLPTVLVLAILLGAAAWWQHVRPVGFPERTTGLERALIETQVMRGYTIPRDVDVLILGDSSGLMGIDPEQLSDLLGGASVESLATMGFVGPRGYAGLLRRYLTERGHTGLVLLAFHPTALEWKDMWIPFERMAIGGIAPPAVPTALAAGVEARLLAAVEPLLYVPLAESMGDFYGNGPGLAAYMEAHHGAAIEPSPPLPATSPEKGEEPWGRFMANQGFVDRLGTLGWVINELGPQKARVILMPMAATYVAPGPAHTSRWLRMAMLHEELHLDPVRQLELPDILPGRMFGSHAHLNPVGRAYFTRRLAAAITKDRAKDGPGR